MKLLSSLLKYIALFYIAYMVAACGGGGSGSDSSSNSSTPTPTNTSPTVITSVDLAPNAISTTVAAGSSNNINTPFVSLTICKSGTANCVTVNNIVLDTGSTGLRVLSSAVSALQLNSVTLNNTSLLECSSFISGNGWGPVKYADVKMSSEVASNIPIQILADPSYGSIPNACGGTAGTQITNSLKANGILGVGLFVNDSQNYYNCIPTGYSDCRVDLSSNTTLQVKNPVAAFPIDNNGVIVKLPSVDSSGLSQITGSLTFGIDTQTNNSSSGSSVIPTNSSGYFTTVFNNTTFTGSFIDSGSNGLYFPAGNLSSVLVNCSTPIGFYCPSASQAYIASLVLKNNARGNISFNVANAQTLVASNNYVYSNIAGAFGGSSFDWGLPFFFGRSVFFGITGRTSNAGTVPLYAYTN